MLQGEDCSCCAWWWTIFFVHDVRDSWSSDCVDCIDMSLYMMHAWRGGRRYLSGSRLLAGSTWWQQGTESVGCGFSSNSSSSASREVSSSLSSSSLRGQGYTTYVARRWMSSGGLPEHEKLSMPALSPTMAQGNIVSWKKKEGDSVQPGDIYCEVETDKASIEWEAQEEGFLAKILKGDGSQNIEVGVPVAILVEEEGDVAAFAEYDASADVSTSAAPAAETTQEPAAAAAFPAHEVMSMPALSPTMSEGTLLKWKKSVGDEISAGDVLAEIETDKASMEWEAQEDGVLAQILVPEGTSGIQVGSPVFVQIDSADELDAFKSFTIADVGATGAPAAAAAAAPPQETTPSPAATPKAPVQSVQQPVKQSGDRVIASPYARKVAGEKGVDLHGLQGSGPGGRIVSADVLNAPVSGGQAAVSSIFTDEATTGIRRVIAQRLLESKQTIPHYYLSASCRIDTLSALRAKLNESLAASDGGKISMNDFVIKASAMALKKVPEANASWHEDFIRQYNSVNCSVAVQTPAGLMVPVVRNADKKGLAAISADVKSLAQRAREGKLMPDESADGTFTVSNLGMFGVTQFSAIVNPPQACILAVGSAEKKVVPSADGAGFEQGTFVNVTLSCDHRVIDGAVGAQWLQAFKGYIEDPASMLL